MSDFAQCGARLSKNVAVGTLAHSPGTLAPHALHQHPRMQCSHGLCSRRSRFRPCRTTRYPSASLRVVQRCPRISRTSAASGPVPTGHTARPTISRCPRCALRMSRLCSSNATPIADLRLLRSNALATGRVSSLRFVLCACARDAGSVAAGTCALVAVACQSCVHASQASAGAAAHENVILSKPHRTGTNP